MLLHSMIFYRFFKICINGLFEKISEFLLFHYTFFIIFTAPMTQAPMTMTPEPMTSEPSTPEPSTPAPTPGPTMPMTDAPTPMPTDPVTQPPKMRYPEDPWFAHYKNKCTSGTRRAVASNNDAFEVSISNILILFMKLLLKKKSTNMEKLK